MKITRKIAACFLFIMLGWAMQAGIAGEQPLLLAENVDECTERYNYCIASCARYYDDCKGKGNDEEYCGGQYTYCQNECENRMKQCWGE